MPKGKRPVEPVFFARTCRKDLFGVLQRADADKAPAEAGGTGAAVDDTWLSYKGRRVVPGPELRRGRSNLYDVVHHTCVEGLKKNPHFTGALLLLCPVNCLWVCACTARDLRVICRRR